jgi:hypothetical protein
MSRYAHGMINRFAVGDADISAFANFHATLHTGENILKAAT